MHFSLSYDSCIITHHSKKKAWLDALPCNSERFPAEWHKPWRITAEAVCQVRLIYLHYNIMMRWLQQQQNTGSKFESQGSKTSQYCILTHPCSPHIHQISCMLFSTQAKGATKHLQRSPQNSLFCAGTMLLMTLSPIKHNEFVDKLHIQFILHILFCRQRPLVHMHRQVFWEKFIFPKYKHAFRDWKNSSPDTLSTIYPPYLKSCHNECASIWTESDGVSGQ